MKDAIKRIWFPLAVVCVIAFQTVGMGINTNSGDPGCSIVTATTQPQDTIHYRNQFLKNAHVKIDTSTLRLEFEDTTILTARDTIFPPDSLREIDPFRYKYYVALLDSSTHRFVVDSLRNAGDSLVWPKIDSIYRLDSIYKAKVAFEAWYAGLSKTDKKKYDFEKKSNLKKHVADSVFAVKDSLKAIKDSIQEVTPRVLDAFAIPDSMQFKRIIQWKHEREFHKLDMQLPDTSYNYRFYDYPFLRKDVNASWLGVAGSPVQYYNYFNRESENGVSFYDPYESWSYSPKTLPFYNTKTAYTELAYFGTLFATSQKESDNLHILTTQNIYPELNYALEYNRFGGNGMLENEKTTNKSFNATVNYVGKRYMLHAGYIYNMINRKENGGITDNALVRDTTIDAREYPVNLTDASTLLKKRSVIIDQQYRIPFNFIRKMQQKKARNNYRDSILATGDSATIVKMNEHLALYDMRMAESDTLSNEDITNAFVGHSSEYSVFTKNYDDMISGGDVAGRDFYNNVFNYNPTTSADSVRVMKFENRVFIRLQPWSDQGIISKINGGIGDRMLNYYNFDPTYIKGNTNTTWNSVFAYAGVEGQLKKFIKWDATGDYVFLGDEINDVSLKANAIFSLYPFRRHRDSPISMKVHFETSLDEPEFYNQHYYSNHFKWDNDFGKISTTKINGEITIPRWNIGLSAGYSLLSNNIYFDTEGMVRQNESPMSVLSASLKKNFALGPLHLDNNVLFQVSSNQDVLPLPTAAINARWYIQFNVKKDVMQMQIGANAWYNTKFYSPSWNPAVGTFHNQKDLEYNNGPYIDAFVNVQWKRACIFVKMENAGMGWPMDKADYFSTNHFIRTQRAIKFGLFWPFYLQPGTNKAIGGKSGSQGGNSQTGSGMGSGMSSGMGGFGGLGGSSNNMGTGMMGGR